MIEPLPDDEPAHTVLNDVWQAAKPFALALLIAKHGEKEPSVLLAQLEAVSFRLCQRISSIVHLAVGEGSTESFACSLRSCEKDGVAFLSCDLASADPRKLLQK